MKQFILTAFLILNLLVPHLALAIPPFFSSIQPLSNDEQQHIRKYSWHPGCPVDPSNLVTVKISYFGFDNKPHLGTLIVSNLSAHEVVTIFAELYQQQFPIQKIIPADYYHGDDLKMMAANDTSAFLCRAMTGYSTVFSSHSYGTAIDINPLINPHVTRSTILPPAGKTYVDRSKLAQGIIVKNDNVYNIFKKHGWRWGGDWKKLKDYQHFEKQFQLTN